MTKNVQEETRLPEAEVTTTEPIGKSSSPRQPHDRDESPDSQSSAPRDDMHQAAADLASGQVNTESRDQPEKNPKNNAPTKPGPASTTKQPDGSEKA